MKITLATIKSFIRKNQGKLYISTCSTFDGMMDCVVSCADQGFTLAAADENQKNRLGVRGAWFVHSGGNYFKEYDQDNLRGYEVNNCCGNFILAINQKI